MEETAVYRKEYPTFQSENDWIWTHKKVSDKLVLIFRIESKTFSKTEIPSLCFLDGLEDPRNLGAMFRLADAARLKEIILQSASPEWVPSAKVNRISRSTVKYIAHRGISEEASLKPLLEEYQPLVLEWTQSSESIWDYQPDFPKPILLIIGHEERGVSDTLLQQEWPSVHIPMLGVNSSMNVAQATAIAVYQLLGKLQKQ